MHLHRGARLSSAPDDRSLRAERERLTGIVASLRAAFEDIVDDDALVCRSLAKAFRRTVDVATAENTSSARALLATNSFDVVLSDFDMPQEDGLTFLRWVAAEYPLMRRVVMTAGPTFEPIERLRSGRGRHRPNIAGTILRAG